MTEKTESTGLSQEEADELILEHKGWSESIAKSVARAWNMDWKLDGLDGAAYEALIFCARRFNPERGVPFKGYARKRIHEASTEAARRSKGWRRGAGSKTRTERLARAVSAELFNVFPELRSGFLPFDLTMDGGSQGQRIAIQQLLVGASVLATKQGLDASLPDETIDYKRMISQLTRLAPIHQMLIWKVYWEGHSLRGLAGEWDTDELNVIREHKVLLQFLFKCVEKGSTSDPPKIRPGLATVVIEDQGENPEGIFVSFIKKVTEKSKEPEQVS